MTITTTNIKKFAVFLGILCLFTLPQLNNIHFDPSPTMWAQLTFAWVCIGLFIFIVVSYNSVSIPFITIPLGIFAIYMLIQPLIVPISFVGLNYITALEMLITILLAISANTIITHHGIKQFMRYLCYSLIIGALLQSAIGLIQYNNWFKYFGGMIFYDAAHANSNIFGHFGQRNHYCHFITWAVFGLIYLYQQKIIRSYIFIPLLFWFMFSITIAASRSVFIYLGLANLITLFYLIAKKDKPSTRLFILTIVATLALVLFEYGYPLLQHLLTKQNITSGFNRITGSEGSEVGRRLVEWQKAIITFKAHPVFGAGLFAYAHNSVFLYQLFSHTPLNSGLFINCHNLILQLLAETGIVGGLIIVIGLIIALVRLIQQATSEKIILLLMATTTLTHSMLEYPLWYLYFLGPLILFLAVDKPIIYLSRKLVIMLASLPILVLCYIMLSSSITFNRLVDYADTPDNLDKFKTQATQLQDVIATKPLLAYFGIFVLDNYINPDNPFTNQTFTPKAALNYERRFTLFQPYPANLIKLAKLEFNAGNQDYAKQLVKIAVTAYPTYKYSLMQTLHSKKYKVLYNIIANTNSQL
jgi:O-antigen ligase